MSMSIPWDQQAITYLISPPPPSHPLKDIILSVRTSMDLNALAMGGRNLLHACIAARMFDPPITKDFQAKIDAKLEDARLAHIARSYGLLERLKVHEVATDPSDAAHILCGYVGATLRCGWKKSFAHAIDHSVNDICSKILDEDTVFPTAENNSHERMLQIDGVQILSPTSSKPAPSLASPMPSRDARFTGDMEGNSNESVSSGRSPPPHMYRPHYQQPYQPYYPPNPSNPPMPPHPMQHVHPQHMPHQPYGMYNPGHVPTSSPAFAHQASQPGPGGFPSGHSAYQPPFQQPPYSSPPPQSVPPPTNGTPLGGWGASQNPPGYTMPPQGAAPAPGPAAAPAPAPMPMPMLPLPTQQTQGFISLFNELAMKNRMAVSWQQQKTGQQHIPEWTMWLIVDGIARGHGTASTKQAAKEIAAKAALHAMGWLPA